MRAARTIAPPRACWITLDYIAEERRNSTVRIAFHKGTTFSPEAYSYFEIGAAGPSKTVAVLQIQTRMKDTNQCGRGSNIIRYPNPSRLSVCSDS